MKKLAFTFVCLLIFISGAFAQGSTGSREADALLAEEFADKDRTKTQIIIPENSHTTEKTATVKIEYSPMYDEVRIYYDCMMVSYDPGEAMNSVLECLRDFQLEHKYYGYKYLKPDRLRYYKNEKGYSMAQYISYVKFSR